MKTQDWRNQLADDAQTARSFIDTLRDIRPGEVIPDLTHALHDLVTAVRATGKKGTLTFTLTLRPATKVGVDQMILDDIVTVKLPKPDQGSTVLFANDDNTLQRHDPRQPELSGLRAPATIRSMPARAIESE